MSRLALLALLTVTSCASLADLSSGQIGCAPEEIQVSDSKTSYVGRTWRAVCRDQAYRCSAHGGPEDGQIACAPEGGPAAGAFDGAAPGGCAYDTQCKEARICDRGRCVFPPPGSGLEAPGGQGPADPLGPPQDGGVEDQ